MYREIIENALIATGHAEGYDPKQVEAWMRLKYGTLDALSIEDFTSEVKIACQCIDADPIASMELADTY